MQERERSEDQDPGPGDAERGASDAPARPRLTPDGLERPTFLLDFPRDPELEALIAAFEAGNYARVRAEAPLLAAKAEDPEVARAALELRRRIDPDPLARTLLLISALLLLVLSAWAYHVSGR